MYTTNLRKVGGSIMLVVPPAFLEQLDMQVGTAVGVAVADGRLVVNPKPRPHYTLKKLLAMSDYTHSRAKEDREWANNRAVGGELL
jgi:antitoxin ChpS